MVFTDRAADLYRRFAGRRTIIGCVDLPAEDSLTGRPTMDDGELHFTAPVRRRPLPTYTLVASHDYCDISLARRSVKRGRVRYMARRKLVLSVPLTAIGAVYLDERRKAHRLQAILEMAGGQGDEASPPRYPPSSEVGVPWPQAPVWMRPVALASPSDSPPARTYGYYSDGSRHAAAVTFSARGRRLFIEVDGRSALYTNVAEHLVRWRDDG